MRERCAVCGEDIIIGNPGRNPRGEFVAHRRHTKAELARLRSAVIDAAAPLTLAALMYLIDPAGFRGATV